MALFPIMLQEGISRSVNNYICNVQPFAFGSDDLNECSAEMAYQIANEAANLHEMFMITDEILAEAAMNQADTNAFNVVNESIFKKIGEGIKKFIDKIIAMVKGIIDRIAAFFYKMTGKTNKWLEVMKPRIEAVKKNQANYADFTTEMLEYDEAYVTEGMLKGISDMVAAFRGDIMPNESLFKNLTSALTAARDPLKAAGVGNPDPSKDRSVQVNAAGSDDPRIKNAETVAKDMATDLTKFQDGWAKRLAGYMQTSATSDKEAIWTECIRKAHKGNNEKHDVKVGGRVDEMLSAIEKSKETINNLKKAYEDHLKTLTDFKKTLESNEFFEIEGRADVPKNVTSAVQSAVNAYSENLTKKISLYESALNSARDKNTGLVQQMAQEYMTVLTKFSGYKSRKAD